MSGRRGPWRSRAVAWIGFHQIAEVGTFVTFGGRSALPVASPGGDDRAMTTLDVLLIEESPGDGTADAARLEAAGHRVHLVLGPARGRRYASA